MANVQIPNLPVAIALSGTEEIEVVQSGTSRRATTQQIADLYVPTTITAAGANTEVQFNDGGFLNGNSNFTFNKTTNQIAIAAGSAVAPTLISTGDTNTGMWFPAADTIAWSTNGTERLRIASGGTVSTTGTLTIAGGAVSISSTSFDFFSSSTFFPQIILVNTANDAFGPFWNTRKLRGAAAANSGDQLGTFVFQSVDTGGTQRNAATFSAVSEGAGATFHSAYFSYLVTSTAGTSVIPLAVRSQGLFVVDGTALLPSFTFANDPDTGFWRPANNTLAASTNAAERLRIDSSGNVGIGTSSPGHLLQVNSTGAAISATTSSTTTQFSGPGLRLYNTNASMGTQAGLGIASLISDVSATQGYMAFFQTNNSGGFVRDILRYDYNASLWQFYTNATEKLRIDTNGNVGIGATVLTNKLNLFTNAAVSVGVNVANSLNAWEAGVNASGIYNIYSSSPYPIVFSNNALERMRIRSDGTVGIGTPFADALLTVNGIASFGAGAVATPSIAAFGDLNTGMWFPAADTIAWSTNGSERLRITDTGEIRIPGNTQLTNAGNNLIYTTAATSTIELRCNNAQQATASSILLNGRGPNDILLFNTNATERMRVHSSGGVSIGNTTDPGVGALIVNSTIRGTQLRGGYNDTTGVANTAAQALGINTVSMVLISADTTLTSTVPPAGAHASVIIKTSGAISRTVTFGTGFKSVGTLATGATTDRFWVVNFVSDGTFLYESSRTTAAYA